MGQSGQTGRLARTVMTGRLGASSRRDLGRARLHRVGGSPRMTAPGGPRPRRVQGVHVATSGEARGERDGAPCGRAGPGSGRPGDETIGDSGPSPRSGRARWSIDGGRRLRLDARPRLSREELESAGSATTEDVDLVRGMAAQSGLKVRDVDRVGRRVVLEGPIEALQDAFGVRISRREAAGEPYLGYAGEIQLPGDLDGVVTAVLGLSDRPAARPR